MQILNYSYYHKQFLLNILNHNLHIEYSGRLTSYVLWLGITKLKTVFVYFDQRNAGGGGGGGVGGVFGLGIWFAQVVNSQILKVKDIQYLPQKLSRIFLMIRDRKTRDTLRCCTIYVVLSNGRLKLVVMVALLPS